MNPEAKAILLKVRRDEGKLRSVVRGIPEAIKCFGDAPSVVFSTGPSKTADVDGIFIEGIHAPGIQLGLVV